MRMEFPDGRATMGWLLLLLGLLGFTTIMFLFSSIETSNRAELTNDFIEGLFLMVFLISSCANKVLRVMRRISGWLLLASIISLLLSIIAHELITTTVSPGVIPEQPEGLQVLLASVSLCWIGAWWATDLVDFLGYGRKAL